MCQLELLKLVKQRHGTLLLQIRQQLPSSKRFESGNIPIKLRTLGNQVHMIFKNHPGMEPEFLLHQKAKLIQQNVHRLRASKNGKPALYGEHHKMRLVRMDKMITTAAHQHSLFG